MRFVTFYLAILMATFMISATDAMAADSVYRWVDEDGNVHFSDQPPGNTDSEVIDIKPSQGVDPQPVTDSTTQAEPEQPSRAQQQRDERAAAAGNGQPGLSPGDGGKGVARAR